MKPSTFVLPVNLLARDDTRIFVRRLSAQGISNGEQFAAMLWLEFGIQQKVWRPMRRQAPEGEVTLEFCANEQTMQLIELGVGWNAPHQVRGQLIHLALECSYLTITKQGDCCGLELSGFGEYNQHFAPGFKSMQQRGAAASAEKKRQRNDAPAAAQQRILLEHQGSLSFEATPKEVEAALSLIMQLDRVSGRKPRLTSEYGANVLERSIYVRRNYDGQRIEALLTWLLHKRDDASVVQGAEAVLTSWEDYLTRSAL